MRSIVLGMCVFAVACSDQVLDSPTSPTSTAFAPAQPTNATLTPRRAQAESAAQLPFSGSFTTVTEAPPPNVAGTAVGNATHLGRFTATFTAFVDLTTGTATGEFNFTAANGDQLFATFVGEGVLIEPNVARIAEVATIVAEKSTGRFKGATGTFTMVRFDIIDWATLKASGYGSFEGHINLNK